MLTLQIETATSCNARCVWCVYPDNLHRAGKAMSMNLFCKIVDDAATIPQIEHLILHGLNEPLLDPMLEERLAYHKSISPDVSRTIYTNGVHLTPERLTKLEQSGLNRIVVSLNAVRPEQHQQIMKLKDKFHIVCANIENAIRNSDIEVGVHTVLNNDTFTSEDAQEFTSRWREHSRVITEGNWAGEFDAKRPFKPNEHCFRATSQIYVMYDGRISACCFDPLGELILGDLSKQSIREAYNAGPYYKFRENHANDKADLYPICANCTRI